MFSELVESRLFRVGCRWVLCLGLVNGSGNRYAGAQGFVAAGSAVTQGVPQFKSAGDGLGKTYTMRVATHEVIVEIVALGSHNQLVGDLKKDEFQVFEVGKSPRRLLRNIVAFRAVDPATEEESGSAAFGGFVVKASAGCAMSFTLHYRLAFAPSERGWTGGKHEIVVKTSRAHVMLAYNSDYYVGLRDVQAKPTVRDDKAAGEELQQAACGGRPAVPPSIALNAHLIRTAEGDPIRMSVAVQPDSLPFLSLSNGTRKVALDYGICSFDADGKGLKFVQKPVERVLSAEDYAQVMATGFPNVVELPRTNGTAMVRFVVLDRQTGNLGSADVVTVTPPVAPSVADLNGATELNRAVELNGSARESDPSVEITPAAQGKRAEEQARRFEESAQQLLGEDDIAKMLKGETPGSFGSIVPRSGAMCGDVYELKKGTWRLPDYWNHRKTGDPVGAVYTDSLNVPYEMPPGIPSLTSSTEWFGIDYHGKFWTQTPGDYRFQMFSDDGAEVYIDDQLVVSNDGIHTLARAQGSISLVRGMHTIHVPYFQQMVHAGLILVVQPPGGTWRVFDVRKFRAPAGAETGAVMGEKTLRAEIK